VAPDGVLDDGWVRVHAGRIVAVGTGAAPAGEVHRLDGGWLLPGFIDLHVHGGGGRDVTGTPEDLAAAVAFHRGHGTTATLVSLVTAPVEELRAQLARVADLADRGPGDDGHVLGAHLEGPFLSAVRCGAQNPAHLLRPDRGVLASLIDAGRGWLKIVTIAPELPGALELIDDLVDAGIVAAVGHTDATYDQARAAFDRGASLATHLFNGMRPIHHREPGPVLAALDSHARCEVINDGVHVHAAVLAEVCARGADRLILITDAIEACGAPPGRYRLGGQDVVVTDGQARLAETGALAGSTLTMDGAVRRAVRSGLPIEGASRAAAANPALTLGVRDRLGAIAPGLVADLVSLDEDLRLRAVMAGGRWVSRCVDRQSSARSREVRRA
jgi:N-acetylglucosamine-6-phosphate deacetylase